eukprot:207657-Pleurochrysis_carterae.AAC.1
MRVREASEGRPERRAGARAVRRWRPLPLHLLGASRGRPPRGPPGCSATAAAPGCPGLRQ